MAEFRIIGLAEGIRIDEDITRDIKLQLLKELDVSKKPYVFSYFKYVNAGWFEIKCMNQESMDWLLSQKDIYAHYSRLNKFKIDFYHIQPYELITIDVINDNCKWDVLKQRLELQNPGLCTKQWRYVSEKFYVNSIVENVKKFLFEVDLKSLDFIEMCDMKLYFNFGRVVVQKFDENLSRTDDKINESPNVIALSLFTKDDLKNRRLLSNVIKEIEMDDKGIMPLKYKIVDLTP